MRPLEAPSKKEIKERRKKNILKRLKVTSSKFAWRETKIPRNDADGLMDRPSASFPEGLTLTLLNQDVHLVFSSLL